MKHFCTGLLVIIAGLLGGTLASAQDVVWTLEGLETPESVYFDEARDTLYVSNIAGEMLEKDGNGFISRVGLDGQMLEARWVTGLDAPKGLVSDGTTLYVSDIDRLVAIDIEAGEISEIWPIEGAVFLNDTAVDGAGRVYSSDTITNKIYVLSNGELSLIAEGEALQHPNGLNVNDGRLVVAGWGQGLKDDLTTEVGGHLLTVDLETGTVSSLGSGAPVGNLDGLEPDGKGNWIVTDWIAGAVFRIAEDGTATMLLDLDMGSADLEYIADRSLLIVPMMLNNTLIAYRVE
jgi:sugar lactone lactonase YvrE